MVLTLASRRASDAPVGYFVAEEAGTPLAESAGADAPGELVPAGVDAESPGAAGQNG